MRLFHKAEPHERFVIVQDDSSHYYVIPLAKKADWNAWIERTAYADPETVEAEDWEAPDFAKPLDGGYGRISFTDPRTS